MKLIKSGTILRSKLHHKKVYREQTPRPTQKDFDKMYADIENKGQQKPVCIDQDFNLIDGYTRDEILGMLRIGEIQYEQYHFETEDEKLDYINSMNVKRRHLSPYQKFEAALSTYEKIKKETKTGPKNLESNDAKLGKATARAAKEADMSTKTFERALTVHNKATDEQKQKLRKGDTKINTIHSQITRVDRNLPKVPLPKDKSDVILADVPIGFNDAGVRGAAEHHYPTMTPDQLVREFKTLETADDAVIFFWMSPSIAYDEIPLDYNYSKKQALVIQTPVYKAILDAAGFKVKAEFVWDKGKIGNGNYNRYQHENLFYAVKGNMPLPAKLFSSVIKELRTKHSRKPRLWPMIKEMFPKRNYLELYAREKTPGVKAHGNQIKEDPIED